MKISQITSKATGQWQSIIHSLGGIDLEINKHGPCPICGGKDRFRFDDLDGRGTFICNLCGAGDGLSLLSKIKAQTTTEAAKEIALFLGLEAYNTQYSNESVVSKITSIQERLSKAALGVSDYFKGKGLCYPSLIVNSTILIPLINIDGKLTGLQYISESGEKKYAKGTIKKGSFYVVLSSHKTEDHLDFGRLLPENLLVKVKVQNNNNSSGMLRNVEVQTLSKVDIQNDNDSNSMLSNVNIEIIISEGVATAVTTKLLYPEALCIAALDAGNLLPVGQAIREKYPLSSIVIAADNDTHLEAEKGSNKGVKWAIKTTQVINAPVAIPSTTEKADWNDLFVHLLDSGLDEKEAIKQLKNDFSESIKKGNHSDFSNIVEITELADGTPLSQEEIERLKIMNQNHTQVILSDGCLIYHKRIDPMSGLPILKPEKPRAFAARYNHLPRIARKNATYAWNSWVGKSIKVDGVGFYPNQAKCPDTVLNLFDGFAVEPIEGDCGLYLNHLENVICSGDTLASKSLISWLAHLVQKPEEKPSFAVVLISEQGAGKGTVIQPLLQILGAFGVYQNGIERITGRFNSTIANKLLVFVDEVHIGRVKEADILKSLISEPVTTLEQKGIDPIQMPNYARFVFASNRTDAIKTGIMERRYLVLETSSQHAQDKAYFTPLWDWINNNGAARLLHYLLHYDISNFDPRRAPQTNALKNQIISNLTGIDGFVYDQLASDNPFNIQAYLGRVRASDLVKMYVTWEKESGGEISTARARSEIGFMIGNILQATKTGRAGRGDGIIYELPDVDTMIQRFAGIRLRMRVGELFE